MAKLSNPIRIGNMQLSHRVVLAPLTRKRADDNHIPLDMARDYYSQRASVPGTLLITEGTFISLRAGGMANVPGIWNQSQIAQWKTITQAVHDRGSYIFCQLWALGRAADPQILEKDGYSVISSSDVPLSSSGAIPRPLSEEEIHGWIDDYAQAARNAVAAGFDGVEIHGANGYLCDQFLQDVTNKRDDAWGGSIENRSRFGLEVARAVSQAIGPERTGYRISPWSEFQEMGMADPRPQFAHFVRGLGQLGLAYVHTVESRVLGTVTIDGPAKDNTFLFDAFGDKGVVILAGGYTAELAKETVEKNPRVAIAFGRHFLANPDLPHRVANGLALNPYERATFYTPKSPIGYVDYPFSSDFLSKCAA